MSWSIWLPLRHVKQNNHHLLKIVDGLLLGLEHILLNLMHSGLLLKSPGHLFESVGHIHDGFGPLVGVRRLGFHDCRMLIVYLDPPCQQL